MARLTKRVGSQSRKNRIQQFIDDGKFKTTCYWCGNKLIFGGDYRKLPMHLKKYYKTLTVDHLIPVRFGGSDKIHNLVLACLDCNSNRSDGWYTEEVPTALKCPLLIQLKVFDKKA